MRPAGGNADIIAQRKRDHLEPFRRGGVEARQVSSWLEHVHLIHSALPELSMEQIDLGARFCGRHFAAPLFITGMTGGTDEAGRINRELACVAQSLGIGFGLGSGRAMLVDPGLVQTYQVREAAPDVFLAWNLGGVQLRHTPIDDIRAALDTLAADALCVHLNPAQELMQPEGDRDFTGVLDAISALVTTLDRPVIVKETGAGISRRVGLALREVGVRHIDVAGCGGTSWVGVEVIRHQRQQDPEALALWDWGIPTAAAVADLADSGLSLIASGGVRTGLDAARALALGAELAGLAAPVLTAWFNEGAGGVERLLTSMLTGLRGAMLLTGCGDLAALRRAERVVTGPLRDWLDRPSRVGG